MDPTIGTLPGAIVVATLPQYALLYLNYLYQTVLNNPEGQVCHER